MGKRKANDKYVTIITQDGTRLIVRDITHEPIPTRNGPKLIDLLPSPKEAAKEGTGPSDSAVNAGWLYSDRGKAPR
jgi:hypothetical protein